MPFPRLVIANVGMAYFLVASLTVLLKLWVLTALHNLTHLILNNFEILTGIIPIELERKTGHRFLKLAKGHSGIG